MLDLSWPELFVIAAVALVIIGPQDIPKIMYGMGRFVRRLQYVRFALSQQFDDFMKDNDLEDIRKAAEMKPDALFDEAAADEEEMYVSEGPVTEAQNQKGAVHERSSS